jgi:hypothetical protein
MSCGTEFGYDDTTISHEALRFEWLRGGGKWFDSSVSPPRYWDAWRQVMEAFYRPTCRSSAGEKASDVIHWNNVEIRKDIPFDARLTHAA